MFSQIAEWITYGVVELGSGHLLGVMLIILMAALILRLTLFHVLTNVERFSSEFEKRVHRFLDGEYKGEYDGLSFLKLTEELLMRTHYETYYMKAKYLRRKLDRMESFTERLFLIEQGSKRLIQDTLKKLKTDSHFVRPNYETTAKFVFMSNPYFNKVFGIFSVDGTHRFLSILPGVFITLGILGTFIGITKGLPELKTMDPSDIRASKQTLDLFLMRMGFGVSASIAGIVFSITLSFFNQWFSPKPLYQRTIEKYKLSLEFISNAAFSFTQSQNAQNLSQADSEDSESAYVIPTPDSSSEEQASEVTPPAEIEVASYESADEPTALPAKEPTLAPLPDREPTVTVKRAPPPPFKKAS